MALKTTGQTKKQSQTQAVSGAEQLKVKHIKAQTKEIECVTHYMVFWRKRKDSQWNHGVLSRNNVSLLSEVPATAVDCYLAAIDLPLE